MKEYEGELTRNYIDGFFCATKEAVSYEECVRFYRTVPRKIYDITNALECMSNEELDKLIKYITRITGKRISFSEQSGIIKMSKRNKTKRTELTNK